MELIESRVAEAHFVDRVGGKDAGVGAHVLLEVGEDLGAVEGQAAVGLVLVAPAVAPRPLRLGGLDKVHARDELILVDRRVADALVVAGQPGGDEVGGRVVLQELLRDGIDAVLRDDVVREGRLGVGVVNDIGYGGEIAAEHGGGGHGVNAVEVAPLAEGFVVGQEEQAVFAVEDFRNAHRPVEFKPVLVPLERALGRRIGGKGIGLGIELDRCAGTRRALRGTGFRRTWWTR